MIFLTLFSFRIKFLFTICDILYIICLNSVEDHIRSKNNVTMQIFLKGHFKVKMIFLSLEGFVFFSSEYRSPSKPKSSYSRFIMLLKLSYVNLVVTSKNLIVCKQKTCPGVLMCRKKFQFLGARRKVPAALRPKKLF